MEYIRMERFKARVPVPLLLKILMILWMTKMSDLGGGLDGSGWVGNGESAETFVLGTLRQ